MRERAARAGVRQCRVDGIAGPVPQAVRADLQRAARVFQAVGVRIALPHRVVECELPRVVARRVLGRPVRAAHAQDQRRRRSRVHHGLVEAYDGLDPTALGVRAAWQRRAHPDHTPRCGRYAHTAGRAERAGRAGRGQRKARVVAGSVRHVATRRKGAGPRVPEGVGKVSRPHRVVEHERARLVAVQVWDRPVFVIQGKGQRRRRVNDDRLVEVDGDVDRRAGAVRASRHRDVHHARYDAVDYYVMVLRKRRFVAVVAGARGRQPAVDLAAASIYTSVPSRPGSPVQRVGGLVVQIGGIVARLDGVRVIVCGACAPVIGGKPVYVPRLERKPRMVKCVVDIIKALEMVDADGDHVAYPVFAVVGRVK